MTARRDGGQRCRPAVGPGGLSFSVVQAPNASGPARVGTGRIAPGRPVLAAHVGPSCIVNASTHIAIRTPLEEPETRIVAPCSPVRHSLPCAQLRAPTPSDTIRLEAGSKEVNGRVYSPHGSRVRGPATAGDRVCRR